MRYEEELIDEVREKNDIVDVISSYVSLKKRGSNYVGLCRSTMKRVRHFLSAGTSRCIIALAADRAEMFIHFLWNITGSPLWRHCKIWHRGSE